MMASRGMGAMSPSKMPKGSRKARRDDTDFTQFDSGGDVSDKEKEEAVKFGVENPRLNLDKNAKELSGRLTAEKKLGKNTSLQAYLDANVNKRGPGIQGAGVNLTHRFAEGGLAKQAATAIAMKKAGVKPKKMAEGGSLKEVDSGENPGLAKLPTDVRNKMGYMNDGGAVGLYANIAAKKKRIASGSGEKMRSAGSAGAPKKGDFANAAKTAKFAEGGKSTVNAAGNYTKPELRKRIFNAVKAEATAGTGAGEWSARKAQMVAQRYKKAGGGYKD